MRMNTKLAEPEREHRLRVIREILSTERVRSQSDLVDLLGARGIAVNQSSVSRDLRELRVAKVGGAYRSREQWASADQETGDLEPDAFLVVRSVIPAGPNLLVVHTPVGLASRVALALDRASWPEVIGTIAGDDCIFIATPGRREQRRVEEYLRRP